MNRLINKLGLAALVAATISTPLHAALTSAAIAGVSGISKDNMDVAVRPQDDFYKYINGTWLKNTAIPADKPGWNAFAALDDEVKPQLRSLIEELAKTSNPVAGSKEQKVVDLYASYMDTASIDALGIKPLHTLFGKIAAVQDKKDIPALLAYMNRIGINNPVGFSVNQDDRNSTVNAVDLSQGGLGLPDRDYYLKDDDVKLKAVRDAYLAHIEKMLAMAGDINAAASAKTILQIETALAKVQWTKVELRDPVKGYNKIEVAHLNELTPGFDFREFLKAVGVEDKVSYTLVGQPSFFTGFAKVVQDMPLDAWKTYFKWHALSSNASMLPANFADENFAFFGTTLRGVPEQEIRWKRAVNLVDADLGEVMGQFYAAKYFPPEYKAKMEKLVANLMAAYKLNINKLDWMSPATKVQAQKKLATMAIKIGYPEKWRDYSALKIASNDLIGNTMRANEFETQYQIDQLGKPINRAQWGMTPQTVNAQYNPQLNDITFPAAILRPPFFNPNADDAVNYGGIGAVIGHEISHAFDDQGSQYDEKGNLRDWWTAGDHKKFAAKTAALVKQYNAFSPLPGYFVNGELTLGENIADNSGLAIAMRAYKLSLHGKPSSTIDGFSGEQRLYIGWAQVWQSKMRDASALVRIKTDPHSPPEFRGNGTLQNQPDFYKAFDIKAGDRMYLAPKDRVIIW